MKKNVDLKLSQKYTNVSINIKNTKTLKTLYYYNTILLKNRAF